MSLARPPRLSADRRKPVPPALAERLVARTLGRMVSAESVLGDLHEEFARAAASHRQRAALWYWTQGAVRDVRLALGATRADVLRLTIGQAGRLTAIGVAIGAALAVALGRLIEAGLLGVVSSDYRMVTGFAAVLIGSALAAGYLPARRAAAVDPVVALRSE